MDLVFWGFCVIIIKVYMFCKVFYLSVFVLREVIYMVWWGIVIFVGYNLWMDRDMGVKGFGFLGVLKILDVDCGYCILLGLFFL